MQETACRTEYIVSTQAITPFCNMLGLATRAGKLAIGASIARGAIQNKSAMCAVLSADASDNTKKRITDSAAFYRIPVFHCPISGVELGHRVGKCGAVAAVAVSDPSFASALQSIYEKFREI